MITLVESLIANLEKMPFTIWRLSDNVEAATIEITFYIQKDNYIIEDTVILYDPQISKLDAMRYPVAIAFDCQKGCEKGLIDAFIKYIRLVLQNAKVELQFAIEDDNILSRPITIDWQYALLEEIIENYKSLNRYDTTYLPYKEMEYVTDGLV